jgi:hypothetical protein
MAGLRWHAVEASTQVVRIRTATRRERMRAKGSRSVAQNDYAAMACRMSSMAVMICAP